LIDMKNLQKGIGLAKVKPALQVRQTMKGWIHYLLQPFRINTEEYV
jgi:hypothetical protein